MKFSVSNYFREHQKLFDKVNVQDIEKAIILIKDKFNNGKKIITCGNGGSALTASHYITDWNKMINIATKKKFKGICLCDNVGLITAFGNDFCYDDIYSGQLKSILDDGDILIAISGSGNSKNVLNAVNYANEKGTETLAIVGFDGGKLIDAARHKVHVPSYDMQLCEDIHLMFGHMVMKSLCNTEISH